MQQELTNEQKARIFALYIGSQCLRKRNRVEQILKLTQINFAEGAILYDCDLYSANTGFLSTDFEFVKLLLRPLSAITDEEALHLTKIVYPSNKGRFTPLQGKKLLNAIWPYTFECFIAPVLPHQSAIIVQFLIQQAFAVPLFIAPGHSGNGKTAVDLCLAQYITE